MGFDDLTAVASLGVLGLCAAMFALSWWFDRRQRSHALFAAQALCAAIAFPGYTLRFAAALGWHELTFNALATAATSLGAVEFTRAHLRRPPARPIRWGFAAAVVGAAGAAAVGSRVAVVAVALTFSWAAALDVLLEVRRLVRAGERRRDAVVLLVSWTVVLAGATPRTLLLFGADVPLDPLPLASSVFAALHAFVLVAERTHALSSAERLHRDVARLDAELRVQLLKRAEELEHGAARLLASLSAPDDDTPGPGTVLDDRYELLEVLGAGGMGIVYAARQRDGGEVALKLLRGRASPTSMARFAREAVLAARVTHPNVVRLIDLGLANHGAVYLVMEKIDGPSLAERIRRRPDAATCARLARDIANGLAAVHAHGILHRDLKPANVLIDRGGAAKIADFGIGALVPRAQAQAWLTTASAEAPAQLTAPHEVIGTPAYMAPERERADDQPSDASDVYSLGLVLYELYVGRPPFATPPVFAPTELAAGARAELAAIAGDDLAALATACLSLDPARRPSAASVAGALDAAGLGLSARTRPP